METSARYAARIESDSGSATARIAVYARLSRDPGGLSVNTSIQVAECLEEVRRYTQDRSLRVEIVAIFEENDISASRYSTKKRPDFQDLIELIRQDEVDVIFATEVERLVRQPAEAERLIDLAGTTDLREICLTGPYPLRWTPGLAARSVGRARNGFDTPHIYAGVQGAVGSFRP